MFHNVVVRVAINMLLFLGTSMADDDTVSASIDVIGPVS